jgi:hypothetical protein
MVTARHRAELRGGERPAVPVACGGGGELRLVLARPEMLRIFSVTGFDQLFPIVATLPEAPAGRGAGAGQ